MGKNKMGLKETLLEKRNIRFHSSFRKLIFLVFQIFPHVAKENNVRKGVQSMFILNCNKSL